MMLPAVVSYFSRVRKAIGTSKQMHERDMLLQLSVDREGVSRRKCSE